MKIIYLILVSIILNGCPEQKTEANAERTIIGTDIEVKPSGNSVVITRYSDSTVTVVNLNKDGELIDSTSYKQK